MDYLAALQQPRILAILAGAGLLVGLLAYRLLQLRARDLYPNFPLVGAEEQNLDYRKASEKFANESYRIFDEGLKLGGKAFQVVTGTGPRIVLPTRYVDEIKSDERLSFANEIGQQFLSEYAGFDAFRGVMHNEIFQDTIKIKITQSLGKITEALSEETAFVLGNLLGESPDWKECNINSTVLDLTTRLSARVFLGEKSCRDEEWLKVSLDYTTSAMHAVQALYRWPGFLRPLANRILPECKQLQSKLQAARDIINPEVERRERAKAEALRKGEKPPPASDTLGWMDEMANGRPFDVTLGQLLLSVVAIHTTSSLMTEVLLDLCAYPEYVTDLRKEIIEIIKEDGWKKASLHKLKLMDSFIKEVQRLRPNSMVTFRRLASADVQLSDGTVLPRGSSMVVPMQDTMHNPAIYENPMKFDGWRFWRMRQNKATEVKAQLVATSVEHLGFGHGKHSCPGRFLAANELKIALCHLLLKYDWELMPGEGRPKTLEWGTEYLTDPAAKVRFRRRTEELAL